MRALFAPINAISEALWWACITELEALKPGNVHVFGAGHGMTVADFIRSARCIANLIATPHSSVGERILSGITATHTTVGCNTNLGIVLLCAPLAHSAGRSKPPVSLQCRLALTLDQLTICDTRQAFAAIQIANPAGLGTHPEHDVTLPARTDLLSIMKTAAHNDRIAYQYTHRFEDIFTLGLATFRHYLLKWSSPSWAAVGVYLAFLSRFADTHIQRKLGIVTAQAIRDESRQLYDLFATCNQPAQVARQLLAFDQSLKQRGINPGTSADLTVATLFVHRLLLFAE